MRTFIIWLWIALLGTASAACAESVLIFGGTGNTGSRIAKILFGDGHQVTVFARPTSKREKLAGVPVDYVVGDVADQTTVQAAFKQTRPDVVIAVLQSRRGQPSPHGDPEIQLVRLSEEWGTRQFIYLSSVGAGPDTKSQRARYPDINFDLFAAGLAEKGTVEQAVLESELAYTIVRSGSILSEFGREHPPGTGRGYFTVDQDVMGPITYDDLAILMTRCVGVEGCHRKIYHATDDTLGPEYNHWRCRRFAQTNDLGAECDHLRPISSYRD